MMEVFSVQKHCVNNVKPSLHTSTTKRSVCRGMAGAQQTCFRNACVVFISQIVPLRVHLARTYRAKPRSCAQRYKDMHIHLHNTILINIILK